MVVNEGVDSFFDAWSKEVDAEAEEEPVIPPAVTALAEIKPALPKAGLAGSGSRASQQAPKGRSSVGGKLRQELDRIAAERQSIEESLNALRSGQPALAAPEPRGVIPYDTARESHATHRGGGGELSGTRFRGDSRGSSESDEDLDKQVENLQRRLAEADMAARAAEVRVAQAEKATLAASAERRHGDISHLRRQELLVAQRANAVLNRPAKPSLPPSAKGDVDRPSLDARSSDDHRLPYAGDRGGAVETSSDTTGSGNSPMVGRNGFEHGHGHGHGYGHMLPPLGEVVRHMLASQGDHHAARWHQRDASTMRPATLDEAVANNETLQQRVAALEEALLAAEQQLRDQALRHELELAAATASLREASQARAAAEASRDRLRAAVQGAMERDLQYSAQAAPGRPGLR
eukprot:jgi/Mesvir1/23868/Mv10664-RA.1